MKEVVFHLCRSIPYFIEMDTISSGPFLCTISHPLTNVTLVCSENRLGVIITELRLNKHRLLQDGVFEITGHAGVLRHAGSISAFLDGNLHDLSGIPIDLTWCTPFAKNVLLAARNIQWGETVSYAELARRAGNGRAIRAAASVMRNNRFPLIIPCHRVIKSDGSIGGFMGRQTGETVELKKRLLAREASFKAEEKLFYET